MVKRKNISYKFLRKLNFLTLIVLSTTNNSFLETEVNEINKVSLTNLSLYIYIIFLFAICPYVYVLNDKFTLGFDVKLSFFLLIFILLLFLNFVTFKIDYLHSMTEKYIKIYKPNTNKIYLLNLKLMGYVLLSWLIFLILNIVLEAIKMKL